MNNLDDIEDRSWVNDTECFEENANEYLLDIKYENLYLDRMSASDCNDILSH